MHARKWASRLVILVALAISLVTIPCALSANAATTHAMIGGGSPAGNAAMNWARAHTWGLWYSYGAAGPSYYDCSGLVMAAFRHAGISLPHSTYSMLADGHLHRVSTPQRGDLAFFGSGHVELVSGWYHQTFGAHHTGTQIGYRTWNSYYAPTAFYRVW